MFPHVSRIALILTAILALDACTAPDGVVIDDARIRDLIPGQDTTAAYFTATNHGDHTITIVGATSNRARALEIHETFAKGDGVAMRRLKRVEVPGGATVRFAPQGKHLMVFGVSELVSPFPITLILANDERIEVSFSKLAL